MDSLLLQPLNIMVDTAEHADVVESFFRSNDKDISNQVMLAAGQVTDYTNRIDGSCMYYTYVPGEIVLKKYPIYQDDVNDNYYTYDEFLGLLDLIEVSKRKITLDVIGGPDILYFSNHDVSTLNDSQITNVYIGVLDGVMPNADERFITKMGTYKYCRYLTKVEKERNIV